MTDENKVNSVFRILYFSGTGNTEWVVKKIRDVIREKGYSCEILAEDSLEAECGGGIGKPADKALLKKRLDEFLTEDAVFVIAFPTYEGNIPRPMRELIPLLPEGNGRKLACVSTMLLAGGDACHLPEKILEKRGYKSFLTTYVKMPGNIKLPHFAFFEVRNGEALRSFYESAGKAVCEIADELIHEKAHFEGRTIVDYLIGVSNRWGEKIEPDMWVKHMFADAKCIKCTLCASCCPTGNIHFEKGHPEFGMNCCVCLRCYSFCPVNAIQITEGTRDETKYPRYKGFDGWKPPRLRSVEIPSHGSKDSRGS